MIYHTWWGICDAGKPLKGARKISLSTPPWLVPRCMQLREGIAYLGRMNNHNRSILSAIAFLVLAVSVGCGSKSLGGASPRRGERGTASSNSPVVNPLSVKIDKPSQLTTVSSLGVVTPTLPRAAASPTISAAELHQLIQERADEILAMKVIKQGSQAKADSLLKTEIITFQERQGSAVGGDPATVAFAMTLVRASDGVELWRADYFFRQEALSDNWLKIGQRFGSEGTGPGWITGRQVLDRGVSSALTDLANRRDAQFVKSNRTQ